MSIRGVDGGWRLRVQLASISLHEPRPNEYRGGYDTQERALTPSLHCRMRKSTCAGIFFSAPESPAQPTYVGTGRLLHSWRTRATNGSWIRVPGRTHCRTGLTLFAGLANMGRYQLTCLPLCVVCTLVHALDIKGSPHCTTSAVDPSVSHSHAPT